MANASQLYARVLRILEEHARAYGCLKTFDHSGHCCKHWRIRCNSSQDFGPDIIGVWLPTLDELLDALTDGGDSRLLAEVHVALLRVVQVQHLLRAQRSGVQLTARGTVHAVVCLCLLPACCRASRRFST